MTSSSLHMLFVVIIIRILIMESLPCFGFEDDDLSETRCRKDPIETTVYTPKICPLEWYMDQNNTIPQDKVEHAKLVILSGNQCFYKEQYNEARNHYERGLALLPKGSSLRRRFVDGIARCCCYLKEFGRAQNLAEEMVSESKNDDQRSSALSLLLTIFRVKDDLTGKIRTLEQWIDIHQLNGHLWKKLSEAYTRKMNLLEARSEEKSKLKKEYVESISTDAVISETNTEHRNEATIEEKVICACLITSRICLEIFQGGQSSFSRLKTSKMLTEIEKEVEHLCLNDEMILDIEDHSKAFVFRIKTQSSDGQKDDGNVQKEPTETKPEKMGLDFQRQYFAWLFQNDYIPS